MFEAVAAALGEGCLRLGTPVVEVRDEAGAAGAAVVTAAGEVHHCDTGGCVGQGRAG